MELECRNLRVSIAGKTVCRDLCLHVKPGQVWGVLGANGAGKTTLLHTLARLRQAAGGEILLQAKPIHQWPRRQLAQALGLLTQDAEDPFPSSVLETALIGRHPFTPAWRMESEADIALAHAALEAVELAELSQRQVATLSGGERQRLALATILTQAPQIFLLDEPTNHLDLHQQVKILQLFRERAQHQGASVVMTMHDVNLAARFCDNLILVLGDGEVAHGPVQQMLSEDYLHRLYRHCILRIESPQGTAYLPG